MQSNRNILIWVTVVVFYAWAAVCEAKPFNFPSAGLEMRAAAVPAQVSPSDASAEAAKSVILMRQLQARDRYIQLLESTNSLLRAESAALTTQISASQLILQSQTHSGSYQIPVTNPSTNGVFVVC